MALLQVDDGELKVFGNQRPVRSVIEQTQRVGGQVCRLGFAIDLEAGGSALDADIKRVSNLRDVRIQRATQIGQTLIVQRLGGEFDALCSRRTYGFTPDWRCSVWFGLARAIASVATEHGRTVNCSRAALTNH